MKNRKLARICRIIESNQIGSTLFLSNSKLTDAKLEKIIAALQSNSTVRKIDLSNNFLSNKSVILLIELVKLKNKICMVNLQYNKIENSTLIYQLNNIIKENIQHTSSADNSSVSSPFDEMYSEDEKEHGSIVNVKNGKALSLEVHGDNQVVKVVEQLIGYPFKDPNWLYHAIDIRRHSYSHSENLPLEWLGDAVLEVVLSTFCKGEQKNTLKSNQNLGKTLLADRLKALLITEQTPDHLIPKYSTKFSKDQNSKNRFILESSRVPANVNAVEAIIGAVFLDSEKDPAVIKSVVLKILNLENNNIRDRSDVELGKALIRYAFTQRALLHYRGSSAKELEEERESLELKYKNEYKDYKSFCEEIAASFLLFNVMSDGGYSQVEIVVLSRDPDVVKTAKMVKEGVTYAYDKIKTAVSNSSFLSSSSRSNNSVPSSNRDWCSIC